MEDKEKYTLKEIIESVLDDQGRKYVKENDSNVRALQRAFDKLIQKLGSDKEVLKRGGKNMEFDKSELPFMKVLITQLYDNEGIIAEFVNEGEKQFSVAQVHMLVESLLNEAYKEGMNGPDLKKLADFFTNIFLVSPLRSIEYCHILIDSLAYNLQDLTSSDQAECLKQVEIILKKEFAYRLFELAVNTWGLGLDIEEKKKLVDGDSPYYKYEQEKQFEYIQRDKAILGVIQKDDDLRKFVEKKVGKKAEEIFNYAALDMENKVD